MDIASYQNMKALSNFLSEVCDHSKLVRVDPEH